MAVDPQGDDASEGTDPRRRRDSTTISRNAEVHLRGLDQDPSLLAGARNALESALGLQPGDRLVLIVEVGKESIGAAILEAASELHLETRTYLVDLDQSRALTFTNSLEMQLREAQGSILIASTDGLDPKFRHMIGIHEHDRRHGHMTGITEPMMRQSMRVDYAEVHALGERLIRRLSPATSIEVVTGPRDLMRIRLGSKLRWHNGSSWLRSPGFANLPGGEVMTTPAYAEGTFRADGGTWIPGGKRLRALTLRFRDGRVVGGEGADIDLLFTALDAHPNGRRVGQIAFGTNIGVLTPIGAMLQDLKMPGFHLVLGYSCPELTGADWVSPVMVPVLCRRPDVSVDGDPVMVRGRYAHDIAGR